MHSAGEDPIIGFYDRESSRLASLYEGHDPSDLYRTALGLIPMSPSCVLDAAAGTGRDAAWLRGMGHAVTAVEPSKGMRSVASGLHPDAGIDWIDDRLPALSKVSRPVGGFAFILAAAVWMHLCREDRKAAWRTLAVLAAPSATALVTMRHGPGDAERPMLPIDVDEEMEAALSAGFSRAWMLPSEGGDRLGRETVRWDSVALVR